MHNFFELSLRLKIIIHLMYFSVIMLELTKVRKKTLKYVNTIKWYEKLGG